MTKSGNADTIIDFPNAPLKEVRIGAQFDPPKDFVHLAVMGLYNKIRGDFPFFQELPPEPLIFEIFGVPNPPMSDMQTGFQKDLQMIRPQILFRFTSKAQDWFIQFQSNKFSLSWKSSNQGEPYPHFEKLFEKFKFLYNTVRGIFAEIDEGYKFQVNQIEIAYFNWIEFNRAINSLNQVAFLKKTNPTGEDVDSLQISWSKTVLNAEKNRRARVYHKIVPLQASGQSGEKMVNFGLVFRGKPEMPKDAPQDWTDLENYILWGRKVLCDEFLTSITPAAQAAWGSQK